MKMEIRKLLAAFLAVALLFGALPLELQTAIAASVEPTLSGTYSDTTLADGERYSFNGTVSSNGGTLDVVTVKISDVDDYDSDNEYKRVNGINASSYALSGVPRLTAGTGFLADAGTYCVKIYAMNEGATEATVLKKFYITVEAPAAAIGQIKLDNLNNSNTHTNSEALSFSWNGTSGNSVYYQVVIKELTGEPNFNNVSDNEPGTVIYNEYISSKSSGLGVSDLPSAGKWLKIYVKGFASDKTTATDEGATAYVKILAAPAPEDKKPVVQTNAATDIGETSVVLHGKLTDDHDVAITSYGFAYSANGFDYEFAKTWNGAPSENGDISYTLTGLTPGTQYSYYFFAINSEGESEHPLKTFTTLNIGQLVPSMTFTMSPDATVEAYQNVTFTFTVENCTSVMLVADDRDILNVDLSTDPQIVKVNNSTYRWTYPFNTAGTQRKIQFVPYNGSVAGAITDARYIDVTPLPPPAAPVPVSAALNASRGQEITVEWLASTGADSYVVWLYDSKWVAIGDGRDVGAALSTKYTFMENGTFNINVYAMKGNSQSDSCLITVSVTCGTHDYKPDSAPIAGSGRWKNNNDGTHTRTEVSYSQYCQYCGVEGPNYVDTTNTVPEPHAYSAAVYEHNADGHWYPAQKCLAKGCGYVKSATASSPHQFDQNGICTICGYVGLIETYKIFYRWDTGVDQTLTGSVIYGNIDEVAYLTIWGKRFVNGKAVEWIQPSNGSNYQFRVNAIIPDNTDLVLVMQSGSQAKINGVGRVNIELIDASSQVLTTFDVYVYGYSGDEYGEGGTSGWSLISEDLFQNDEYALDGADGYIYYFQGVGRLRLKIRDNTTGNETYPSQSNGWFVYVNDKLTTLDSECAVNLKAGITYTIRLEYTLFGGNIADTLKVTVYATDPALEGASQYLKYTVITNISSESDDVKNTRDMINTNADLMRQRIDEISLDAIEGLPLANGDIADVFDPKNITSAVYLNRDYWLGHSAVMLVDKNGNSMIYSFYPAEGEFIALNSGESHMRYMNASETYDFLYSTAKSGQLSSLEIGGNNSGNMVTNNSSFFTEEAYHRAVIKIISNENGELMYDVCVQLFANKDEPYNVGYNNCNDVAIQIFTLNTDISQQQREFANAEGWVHNFTPEDTLNALVNAGYDFIVFGGNDELTSTHVSAADLGYQVGDELYGTSTALTENAKANWRSLSLEQKKLWYELRLGKYDSLPFNAGSSENSELADSTMWFGRQVEKTARSTVIFFSDPTGEVYSLLVNSIKNVGSVTEYIWSTATNDDHISDNDRRAFAEVLVSYWTEEIVAGNITTDNIDEYVELLRIYQEMQTEQERIDIGREIIHLIPGVGTLSVDVIDYILSGSGDIIDNLVDQYSALLVIEAIEQKAISVEGYPDGVREAIFLFLNTKRNIAMTQIEDLIYTSGEMVAAIMMSGVDITFTIGSFGAYNVIEAGCTALSIGGNYEKHNQTLSLVEGAYKDYAQTVNTLENALNAYVSNPTATNYAAVVNAVTPYKNAANAMIDAFFAAKAFDGNDYDAIVDNYHTNVNQVCDEILGR